MHHGHFESQRDTSTKSHDCLTCFSKVMFERDCLTYESYTQKSYLHGIKKNDQRQKVSMRYRVRIKMLFLLQLIL